MEIPKIRSLIFPAHAGVILLEIIKFSRIGYFPRNSGGVSVGINIKFSLQKQRQGKKITGLILQELNR